MKLKSTTQIKQELRNPDPRIRERRASALGHSLLAQDMVAELLAIADVVREDSRRHQTALGEYTVTLCEKATHALADRIEKLSAGQCRAAILQVLQEAQEAIAAWVTKHGATPEWLEASPWSRPAPVRVTVPHLASPKPMRPMRALQLRHKGVWQ